MINIKFFCFFLNFYNLCFSATEMVNHKLEQTQVQTHLTMDYEHMSEKFQQMTRICAKTLAVYNTTGEILMPQTEEEEFMYDQICYGKVKGIQDKVDDIQGSTLFTNVGRNIATIISIIWPMISFYLYKKSQGEANLNVGIELIKMLFMTIISLIFSLILMTYYKKVLLRQFKSTLFIHKQRLK